MGDNADQQLVNTVDELERRIRQATTFNDLDAVLEDAQRQYEAGDLDAETVERLAPLAQQEAQTLPENAADLRLSHLFAETPIRRVYSKILGETVVFAADGVELSADLEGVVYRASELRQRVGCSPERLRAIHPAKRHFDGERIDGPAEGAILPVEDLLDDDRDPDACPTCGRDVWWTQAGGERVCSVCHPRPKMDS